LTEMGFGILASHDREPFPNEDLSCRGADSGSRIV
jgi:hypothetical protein